MSITSLAHYTSFVDNRKRQGKPTWFYNFCKPYPPHPNRWFDLPLTNSRLYPLLAYKYNAGGYLFWAANLYRGADPYKGSIGPVGYGATYGHPPGDNWLFYPGPDGLRGSMRMLVFRDGLLDHALLMKLAEKDRDKADEIVNRIVRSLTDYETNPLAFHKARKDLLEALE